jgi:hypothetical protein
VTDGAVRPKRAVLGSGQRVAWVSYAGSVRIVFDAEVARSMLCDSLVNFSLDEGRLRSGLLQPGDVARFCELEPGVYHYRVERDEHARSRSQLSNRIEGWLVVQAD